MTLFKLQKKVVRIISNNKYNAYTDPIFKYLNILKLNDIYKLQLAKFFYKYIKNELARKCGEKC